MRKFENIIQSEITPSTNSLHLKDGALFYYNNGEWKPISSGPNAPNFVGCTEEEYNSLESKDSNILYVINSNSGIDALYAGKNKVWKKPSNRFKGQCSLYWDNTYNLKCRINNIIYDFSDKVDPETGKFDFEYDGEEIKDFCLDDGGIMGGKRTRLQSIESLPDTSKIISAAHMFNANYYLKEFDCSCIDISNCVNTIFMFAECEGLYSLDISTLDMSKVYDMSNMFDGCAEVPELDFSNINLSNIRNMNGAFSACYGLTSIKLSHLANVANMSSAFQECTSLEYAELSIPSTNLVDMSGLFYSCSSLKDVKFSSPTSSKIKVNGVNGMFNGCESLKALNLPFDTKNVTNMSYMFYNCTGLHSLSLNFDMNNVVTASDMFSGCADLTDINGEITNIKIDLDLSTTSLSRSAALVFINGLSEEARPGILKVIKFSQSTYNTLNEGDITLASGKGWTIVAE